MKIVLDSNVLVAAFATHGLCHTLYELCLLDHTVVLSEDIVQEVNRALTDKIKAPAPVVKDILAVLRKNALLHQSELPLIEECRDPDDAKILGLAIASKCDCLVSGDQDLLVLKNVQGIPILSPREFYTLLQQKS